MSETDKSYGLLSETSGIGETRDPRLQRHLPLFEGIRWLAAGWRDSGSSPVPVWRTDRGCFVLSDGFRVDAGRVRARLHPVSRARRVHDRGSVPGYRPLREEPGDRGRWTESASASCCWCGRGPGAQVFFTGLLLCLLMLLWMRAAVLLYALFFGVSAVSRPRPHRRHAVRHGYGWTMVIVGTAIGGLFAAFAFAISVFSVPMLLDRPRRRADGHGYEHEVGVEQPSADDRMGRDGAPLFAVCVATGLSG